MSVKEMSLYFLGAVPIQYFGLDPIDPQSSYSACFVSQEVPIAQMAPRDSSLSTLESKSSSPHVLDLSFQIIMVSSLSSSLTYFEDDFNVRQQNWSVSI